MDASSHYRELAGRVDAFFRRVEVRHGTYMRCQAGCSACCGQQLTVTAVEAQEIRRVLAALDDELRARVAARASAPSPTRCSALEEDGRCAIYEGRPLVCRSHGVPVRVVPRPGALPVVQACELNFTAGFDGLDADCVLDQTTLSTVLAAVDAAFADAAGLPRGERTPLAELLR